jgi:hypothetical protein
MDASRRPLRAVGRKGLSDARKRQIRGTRQPKPNSRAGATPRRYIATIVSTTRRGHRSRGKLGVPRSSRALPRHLLHRYERGLSVVQPESREMDDNQQSHRRQEVAARARRSGSLRPRSGRNATACTANEPRCRCPGCCSARPLPDKGSRARRRPCAPRGQSRSSGTARGAPDRRDRRVAKAVARRRGRTGRKRSREDEARRIPQRRPVRLLGSRHD